MCYVIPIVHAMLLRQGMKKSASADPSATLGKQTHYVLLAVFMRKGSKSTTFPALFAP